MTGFSVPGFVPVEGDGLRPGRSCVARDLVTGELVVLQALPAARDRLHRDRLRRRVTAVARVQHPHLAVPRAVVDVGEAMVLVRPHHPGPSLEEVAAARGGLPAGEVVTVGVPLADALAALHERGLVHGHVRGCDVVVTHDGRPVLAGLGDAAATHGPADDVRDLAATCLRALGEAADGAGAGDVEPGSRESVRRVLAAVIDARSAPDARGLSRALFAAAVARPVRPVGEDRSSPATARAPTVPGGRSGRHRAPAEGRRPRPAATAVAAVAAAVVVTAAAGAGARWAVVDDLPAPARVPAGADGWRGVLGDLDDLRAEAFATADLGALGEVYAADGPALSRDRAAMTRLAHAGLRAEGMRLATVEVTERSRAPGRVRLRVADVLRSYRLVDRAGRVVDVRAGRGLRRWTVTLARAGGRWKVYDVARE